MIFYNIHNRPSSKEVHHQQFTSPKVLKLGPQ